MHVRHEEVAAFAAGAEAHLTGELAVCAGSCGPGNMHLINGLYDCHRSRVPVLAIAAQIPSAEIGSGYFQETHPEHLFKRMQPLLRAGFAARADAARAGDRDADGARAARRRGGGHSRRHRAARLRGGCAARGIVKIRTAAARAFDAESWRKRGGLLNKAKKVDDPGRRGLRGRARGTDRTSAGSLKAPIVHALRGKEYIEYDNPYDVGMTGLLGFSSGYHAMMECDALLMLGTDFPYQQFYPEGCDDHPGGCAGRADRPPYAGRPGTRRRRASHVGGAGAAARNKRATARISTHCLKHYAKTRKGLDELAVGEPGRKPIHPQYRRQAARRTGGRRRHLHLRRRHAHDLGRALSADERPAPAARFVIHGSMANALPQAIGAQAALPDRQVVTLSGDGGLAMLLGDLLTLKQANLPVKVVVFNNSSLGFVELEMKAAGQLSFGTDLVNPNFAKLALSADILGIRVEAPEDVRPALQTALAHDGPCLVDVVVNRHELAMPPTITAEQALGFSLYMIRAVLSGRGDEVIDLAKTNFLAR